MTEAPTAVDQKCEAFLFLVNAIRDAGLEPDRGILLFDTDGNLWKKQPWQMNVNDVIEYVEHRFGPPFTSFIRQFPDFITH
jgi:hypothetical protein